MNGSTKFVYGSNHPAFWAHRQFMIEKRPFVVTKNYHFINAIPFGKHNNYTLEIEHPYFVNSSRNYANNLRKLKKNLRKIRSKDCRKVIVWSQKSFADLSEYLDLNKEIIVAPPPVEKISLQEKEDFNPESLTVLFIGNKFIVKGGLVLLDVISSLSKEIKIKLILISNDAPKIDPIANVEILKITTPVLNAKEKSKFLATSDIAILPVLHDSYGFYAECLKYGLPLFGFAPYDKEIFQVPSFKLLRKPPIELYSDGYGARWRNYDEFVNVCIEEHKRGIFDNAKNIMTNDIQEFLGANNFRNYRKKSDELIENSFNIRNWEKIIALDNV